MGTQEATAAPPPGSAGCTEAWPTTGCRALPARHCPHPPGPGRKHARVFAPASTHSVDAHTDVGEHVVCTRSACVHVGVYVYHTTVRK